MSEVSGAKRVSRRGYKERLELLEAKVLALEEQINRMKKQSGLHSALAMKIPAGGVK